jgi:succinoglycan biosynthesis transport protein ExoP
MEATRTDETKAFTAPETKLHFLDYWRIIRIRKTVILAVFLLVSLTTTVVTYLLKPGYRSKAIISIEQDLVDVDPRGGNLMLRPPVDPFFIQTEFQRIQSKPVLYRVIDDLNLTEQWGRKFDRPGGITKEIAYQMLKGSVRVSQIHNTSLIEIQGYSDDKDEAANLAQKVADVYKEVRGSARSLVKSNAIVNLRAQLREKEQLVTNRVMKVNELREQFKIADYEDTRPTPTIDQETLRMLNTGLLEAERSFSAATNLYSKLAGLDPETLKKAAPLAVPGDAGLAELISQENAARQKLTNLLSGALGANHPDVTQVRETLKEVQRQLDNRLQFMMIGLELRMQTERANMETYQTRLAEGKRQDNENFAKTRPYYEAKEDLAQIKFQRDKLAQSIDSAQVELNTPTAGTVQLIEQAEPDSIPYKPNKKLNIALGIAFGLLVGIGLAFFIEYLDTSVKTIDDVERALQAAVLGVIPQNVGLLIDEGPDSPHAEAYRVLRTNVLFSRKDPKLNSLTVVSGGAGEGKSTTIFNLATVFAQNGQRVLVVDSDLRRPSLHKYLHISNAIGLTNYLLKQNTIEEVIQTTSQPNMDFMPSGRLPSSSLGILSSMQMKELIRDVKRRYDFVFFDSPPIMGVSDASILASEVDMVLQVIQYRRYPQPMTIRAKQMIEKVGGNLLGIVLNNINVSQDENYYYYSGYYYDYYSKGEYTGESTSGGKKKGGDKTAGASDQETKVEIKSKF